MTGRYLDTYDAACDRAAAQVMAHYSTSFSLATRLLPQPMRTDIRNLYAVVRIADEIVDGTTAQAHECAETALDAYEAAVLHAPAHRFHADPVLHAFAATARACRFPDAELRAFFASMRSDLPDQPDLPLGDYIYGSAEVIGLLCLRAFYRGDEAALTPDLADGARALGSAFQKINFLRDVAEDSALGRSYTEHSLIDAPVHPFIPQIRTELAQAKEQIPNLPARVRPAVKVATALFEDLTDRIEATPPAQLRTTRVRVPNHRKLAIAARALRQ